MSQSVPVVERVDATQRYDIRVGGTLAGRTECRDHDQQRVFFHTEVDDAFAGQGLAPQLVQQALADARASGMRIVPVCPYVARFLTRHDEFADATDPVNADVLQWLEKELA